MIFIWDKATGKRIRIDSDTALVSIPIGFVIASLSTITPRGFLPVTGGSYLRSNYPELYEILPDVLKISETEFILPDTRGRVIQGAINNLGDIIEAGLPNITGIVSGIGGAQEPIGAFYSDTTGAVPDGAWSTRRIVKFDASKGETDTDGNIKTDESTKVYGKSNTVQPPAVAMNYFIKATNYTDARLDIVDDQKITRDNVFSAAQVIEEIKNRTSLDWNNAVETVATNTNENTFNVTTDGVLFYDLAGFYGNNCYVKINDITIAFGSSNGNVWVVSKTGSCIVSEGDVIKWKEGYVGDWMSTHKIVFVPYKS